MEQIVMCFDEPERWLPIAGYEGMYEVSDLGRVRSLPRFHAGGRVLKPSYCGPVASVGLRRDGRSRTFSIHGLVARAFLGPCPEGMEVCHGPAGRRDNRLVNLSYGTKLKNNGEDKRRDGTAPIGIRNPNARLTDEIVRECRRRVAVGESCAALAREFGVEYTSMQNAVAGDAWRHVTTPQAASPGPQSAGRRKGRPRVRPIPGHPEAFDPEAAKRPRVAPPGQQVVTVRWDAHLLQAARMHAASRGLTFSDVVRLAVVNYLEENSDGVPMPGSSQLSA